MLTLKGREMVQHQKKLDAEMSNTANTNKLNNLYKIIWSTIENEESKKNYLRWRSKKIKLINSIIDKSTTCRKLFYAS